MKKSIWIICLISIAMFSETFGHGSIKGKIYNATTKMPLPTIYTRILNSDNRITYSDPEGMFEFKGLSPGTFYIQFSSIGYKSKTDTVEIKEEEVVHLTVYLEEDVLELPAVVITARKELSQTTINSIDFKLRTHTTTQELLRLVPGLFIAQHAGGGKAEQIFLRGFDVDHGTDVAISVDGMPVNMVSQAHGQGYADLHFVIPETVDNMSFSKGPYDSRTGDFNTAGAVRFQTKNSIRNNELKYEAGRFGMQRGLAMINLLPSKDSIPRHNAYIASEYFYTKGYFLSPQHFHRFNILGKYNGDVSKHSHLTFSISTFNSRWDASGQIPQRAVDRGEISWFGSIDPTEGGNTARSNANLCLTTYLPQSGVLRNQFYFTDYRFNLYSNFTFFKEDSIHGDQIYQYEHRHLFGYYGSYSNDLQLGDYTLKIASGIGFRGDRIKPIGLAHTFKRNFLNDIKRGAINENNFNGYIDASFLFSDRLTVNAGLRYDYFIFQYRSSVEDTVFPVIQKGLPSPKFNLYYKAGREVQLYASAGYGFHSNDARVAVYRTTATSLPRAKSADLGANFKMRKRIFVNAAIWYMFMQTEFVYSGDDGLVGPSGRTRRVGFDLSARYQILSWLFADADLNLARPRYMDLPEGENYIPLAPAITSAGGIGVNGKKGFSGSLRYRYLGRRPAIEDNSVEASGYFIIDALVNYQRKNYQLSLSAENLLNRKWREAQFGTESRLQGEPAPVTEIHFTPGAPLFIKGGVTYLF